MTEREPNYFKIDKLRLDEELDKQVEMYDVHSHRLADARREYERAKANKELTIAEIDASVRNNPESFGVKKVTDRSVEMAIIRHSEYQNAVSRLIETKHFMDCCQADVDTLDQRKKAIEGDISLMIGGFIAEPRVPRAVREALDRSERDEAFIGRKKVNK